MKIIIVHNRYQQPGGEDVVFEQERHLLERTGHSVIIYSRSNLEIDGVSASQRIVLVKDIIFSADTRQEFARLLAKERPHLVHIHNTFVMVSPSIYSACVEANIPVVQTLHNYRLICPAANLFRDGHVCEECIEHNLWRGVRHGCYRDSRLATGAVALMLAVHRKQHTWDRKVNGYIALSEFARSKFVEGGLPADKIFVKPNFVYPDPQPDFCAGEYAVFAGRLSPEKGIGTLLAAWNRLHNRIPLLIIGDGPQRSLLETEAEKRGLSSVSFLGRLAREETWVRIRQARMLIVPSGCYENFPLTIAESFACATPVICSGLGAMQEIVENGRTGLHFTAGDPDDLAAKVEWAWQHPQQLQTMRREARSEYEAKYTAERNYEILTSIYRRFVPMDNSMPTMTPPKKQKSWVYARRTVDVFGKAWAYLMASLQQPGQLFRIPALVVKRVHIGEFLKLNKPWLKEAGVKTVIDVGAHTGEFSSAIHSILTDAHVYAFEPLPDCCSKLRTKLGNNGFLNVFQVALGDRGGPVQFWRSNFSKSSSVLRMSNLHEEAFPWTAGGTPTEVQLQTLDDYADRMELASKTLLKIDVQGFEDRVLRGAVQTLKKVNYVLVEVSVAPLYDGQAQFDSIYEFLLRAGFQYTGNLEQLVSPLDGTILQVDALFTRNRREAAQEAA